MTYVTRLSVRKKNEMNNKRNINGGKGRSNHKQKSKVSQPPQRPQFVKVYISGILDIKIENNEEYALLGYSDPNLVPDWQPMRNLRNANPLIEKFRNHLIQVQAQKENTFVSNDIIMNEENCTESTVTTPDTISNVSESSKSSVTGDDIVMEIENKLN